jgi:hypothetical protein
MDSGFQQADFLLDQAADLFERALRSRADYDDLRSAGFKTVLDVLEFDLLDHIHMNEADAGFYNLDAADSHADLLATEALQFQYGQAELGLTGTGVDGEPLGLATSLFNEQDDRALSAMQMGFLPSAPLYTKDVPPANGLEYAQWPANPLNPTPPTADKVRFLAGTASGIEFTSISDRIREYKVQATQMIAQSAAAEERIPAKKLRRGYDNQAGGDAGFQVQRTLVQRSVNEVKSIAMSKPGGPLNYSERLTSLSDHFIRDVESALARIMAASDGLTRLFGYQVPLPDAVILMQKRLPVPDDPGRRLVDECVEWTRNAIDFLVRFRQLDQNYALPLSLRVLAQIPHGQPLPTGSAVLSFVVPESLFQNAGILVDDRNVRLRGVSAFVMETGDIAGLWDVIFRVPPQAFCRLHPSNVQPGGPVINQLDQSDVPPCRVAAVERRTSEREPTVVGTAALFNVSPLSSGSAQWTAVINPVPGTGADPNKLADVFVVLHVAVRSAIGALPPRGDETQFRRSTQMRPATGADAKVYKT